jgi:hypothetical protein
MLVRSPPPVLPLLVFLLLLSLPAAAAAQQPQQPYHRSVMTLLVEHREQFAGFVDKIAAAKGAINVAAPICFNPGHIGPTTNFSNPYCLADFLVPMKRRDPRIRIHPIIQMANSVLLSNLKHFGWFTKAFKAVALEYDALIDGFLFYPQLASKVGHQGDAQALRQLLDELGDELHAINKTLGVFIPNYHSKFSPTKVLQESHIDYWLTNLEVKTCGEVALFYKALHGQGLSGKGGGTLFTSDGAFNSAGCMEQLFGPTGALSLPPTGPGNSTTIGFYTDFSSMGNLWWEPMAEWASAGGREQAAAPVAATAAAAAVARMAGGSCEAGYFELEAGTPLELARDAARTCGFTAGTTIRLRPGVHRRGGLGALQLDRHD